MSHTTFTAAAKAAASVLEQQLSAITPSVQSLVVAYSGGVDSTLLLLIARHVAQHHGYPLQAVYVHHGLSDNATYWQQHCESVCREQDIPFVAQSVTIKRTARVSTEAQAREARYAVLTAHCRKHQAALLLGHHQQDQLETVLLQLKRGAGPKGLAGMGREQRRDGVWLLRPLLDMTKAAVTEAVTQSGLRWIEDESNQDTTFERNFLRHEVVPLLQTRWPQFAATVSRSAALCAEQTALIEEEAQEKLSALVDNTGSVCTDGLLRYSVQWQRALLRQWLSSFVGTIPSHAQLNEIQAMMAARADAQPEVRVGEVTVRRFNARLYAVPASEVQVPDVTLVVPGETVTLDWLGCDVCIADDDPETCNVSYKVVTGMPPVSVKPLSSGFSKPLNKWLKAWLVPPWQRQRVGVLYRDDTPAAIILPQRIERLVGFESLGITHSERA
ncbi:tRNA lysidine(34) synthetase TilS [Alteromonas sp. CYL-A6]|uniref:tRNA lysidine(34) synthetase TilS n=1 Tax=Alteromonas nitratireducens TaxID=3390813 RepID=UPI0034C40788